MAQIQPQFEEAEGFIALAGKLAEKYPEHFSEIDVNQIIAYVVVNKDRPEKDRDPYKMSGVIPPQSLTNSKTYFVTIFNDVWDRTEEQKLALVFSALSRIDPSAPGKIRPFDYSDQKTMVNTFGPDWHEKGDLPHLLTDSVDFR